MRSGRPIAASTLPKMLKYLGISAVPHGFRSSFRDWAAEHTDHPREAIEAALAHVEPNKLEAAYARSDLFERRLLLMDDWSAYLSGEVQGMTHRVADAASRESATWTQALRFRSTTTAT